ncbi:mandelate racemase/muconate lactonizing enzyme family protein [Neolewinella antarctica]|uniref:Dipeptide epimerase n=1 Tax=Neolewinella antarctica TaxID=442734 RepID=A0ABX0XAQ5_9BACT|nr:dipeptide epimerase [Neolewinella antarctica]NJC26364.1 L-alanine-DL-glutamate epimerase-like enolase superfamily enzyme [Neolewinella antarctica]
MKIAKISFYEAPISLREPFIISLGPLTHANNVFVKLETDTGLTGWGEASPFPMIHGETMAGCVAVGQYLARQLLTLDPADHAGVLTAMDGAIYGNSCIKGALEIACYDVAARAVGQPLYAYLGAHNDRDIRTDYTISLGSVEAMVAKARWIKARGFSVIKIKLGARTRDAERVRAISEAVGPDVPLRLDANQGWSKDQAITVLRSIEDLNVQHCEEPIDKRDWHLLREIREATTIPLMADETCWDDADARRLIDHQSVDRLNVKLSKTGGFTRALRIAELAGEANIPLQIGGFLETRLGFTAAAHFGLLPAVTFYDLDTPLMQSVDPIVGGMVYGAGGRVSLPNAPGLGASVAEPYLRNLDTVVIE